MARRSASSGVNGKEPPPSRNDTAEGDSSSIVSTSASSLSATEGDKPSDRFLQGLAGASAVTFVSHVHPDPDSLGSMMGLAHLVEQKLGKPTRMIRDGVISRAENRAMVELLDLELVSIDQLNDRDPGEAVVMVDSQPNTGRHNFPCKVPLYAVIDHHDTPGDLTGVSFVDVRQDVGATCTLVTSYLREQQVSIPPRLATGLLYGVETEVAGYPREAGELDEDALHYLYPLADKDLLARIRHARLPQSYFGCLVQALQSSFIYDRLIVSWINDLPQPELAAEVADFLMRFEEVEWALAAGVYEDKLILSMRSSAPEAKAGDILRRVVNGMGKAGGHDRRAGGTIYLTSTSQSAIDDVRAQLRRRLLRELAIEECRGQRLVSRRELLQNLHA